MKQNYGKKGSDSIGHLLSDYCRYNDISQKEIINKSGVSKSRISKFFNGHLNIGSSDFLKILRSVNIDLEKAIEKKSVESVISKKVNKSKEILTISDALSEVLNGLDDLGKQSCLSQILFAAKLSNKNVNKKAVKLIQQELNKI